MAPPTMSVFFLGTSSGGGPSESRNCSSLLVDALGNGDLWMVDCAEGTLRQFSLQPGHGEQRFKPARVRKIFVTHMHADHIMGIITMLRHVLRPPWFDHSRDGVAPPTEPTIELFGPAGLRNFVRACLFATATRTADKYVVHELLGTDDLLTSCTPEHMHGSEAPGRDIRPDDDGFWQGVLNVKGYGTDLVVDAGPIVHRDPCIGYVFRETTAPERKLVILGDTVDPSAILPLLDSLPGPSPSLLVHEATDAYIPPEVDYNSRRSVELVAEKCVERGHSTPVMAGAFARRIGAERLVLNHIGSRFPAPPASRGGGGWGKGGGYRERVMAEIARQAEDAWLKDSESGGDVPKGKSRGFGGQGQGPGRRVITAVDFTRVDIPPTPSQRALQVNPAEVVDASLVDEEMDLATTVPALEDLTPLASDSFAGPSRRGGSGGGGRGTGGRGRGRGGFPPDGGRRLQHNQAQSQRGDRRGGGGGGGGGGHHRGRGRGQGGDRAPGGRRDDRGHGDEYENGAAKRRRDDQDSRGNEARRN